MREWNDVTLIAIQENAPAYFQVWELPAHQLLAYPSRRPRKFKTEEKAQDYINQEYRSGILQVQYEDIEEEIVRRKTPYPCDYCRQGVLFSTLTRVVKEVYPDTGMPATWDMVCEDCIRKAQDQQEETDYGFCEDPDSIR